MTTLWYSAEAGRGHVNPPGHPEQVARLDAVEAALARMDGLERREAPVAAEGDITLCHPTRYLDRVRNAVPTEGRVELDADTTLSPGSFDAAMRAAGGMVAAIDAVLDGAARNAFVGCRPPGHHAEVETAMGFCLFGNVAIGAMHALERRGLSRVAIVDFDVHHGNGTQDLLWDEARVLFVSSHQMPLYPGTGAMTERGAHRQVMNLPLPPGSDGVLMREIYETRVLPALRQNAPELLLISAGFDAHAADPLAQLEWQTEDYTWLTEQLCDVADAVCGGRVVSTLEGGYDLAALEASVAAHVAVLRDRSR
ncbi:histone deacetylase superfamily protein [Oceaniovalibus guishaninsula JLT2003]|uniref:Histone deacetylase superfamily protein n=1 Tax=Oceaniovalibus guishaninsula JLT2003 TaxID=1231392 RepID=K2GPK8_9RHOB|nr:histone deacetylase family protein [Oceaniovalibus guishaninsula]EKE44591.1 histone deacetylase superfamily protein [Oceaniovalibus guishaninsula JLT2003]